MSNRLTSIKRYLVCISICSIAAYLMENLYNFYSNTRYKVNAKLWTGQKVYPPYLKKYVSIALGALPRNRQIVLTSFCCLNFCLL